MNYQWKIGELAVCVNDSGYKSQDRKPTLGSVYTCAQFRSSDEAGTRCGLLWFHEIWNKGPSMFDSLNWSGTAAFPATDFRPLGPDDFERIAKKHQVPKEIQHG